MNNIRFTYRVIDDSGYAPWSPPGTRTAVEIPVDQSDGSPFVDSAVATGLPDFFLPKLRAGDYFTALTRDDLGAIKYLLHTNNVNVEPVLSSIRALDGSANFVDVAARPGVDKITFQRMDPGARPVTNIFVDRFFEDGEAKSQTLRRVIAAPDIVFTASNHPRQFGEPPIVRRTRPNYSHANPTGTGIFQPEVVISFHKLGDIYREPLYEDPDEGYLIDSRWGSFDSRTVTPSIFPAGPAYEGGRTLSTRQVQDQNSAALEWKLRLVAGVQYTIESSADLRSWTAVTNIIAAPIHTLTNRIPSGSFSVFWRARRISGQ